MYRSFYKNLFRVFVAIGILFCIIGGILFFALGKQAGQLMHSDGTPSGLYLNLFLLVDFAGIGAAFMLMGWIGLYYRQRKEKNQQKLKEHGKRLDATVIRVERNLFVSMKGRHPYQVIAEYIDESTKTIYHYRSECIKEEPHIQKGEDFVSVYVDPENYKKYYMDISDLVELKGYKVENL